MFYYFEHEYKRRTKVSGNSVATLSLISSLSSSNISRRRASAVHFSRGYSSYQLVFVVDVVIVIVVFGDRTNAAQLSRIFAPTLYRAASEISARRITSPSRPRSPFQRDYARASLHGRSLCYCKVACTDINKFRS